MWCCEVIWCFTHAQCGVVLYFGIFMYKSSTVMCSGERFRSLMTGGSEDATK